MSKEYSDIEDNDSDFDDEEESGSEEIGIFDDDYEDLKAAAEAEHKNTIIYDPDNDEFFRFGSVKQKIRRTKYVECVSADRIFPYEHVALIGQRQLVLEEYPEDARVSYEDAIKQNGDSLAQKTAKAELMQRVYPYKIVRPLNDVFELVDPNECKFIETIEYENNN